MSLQQESPAVLSSSRSSAWLFGLLAGGGALAVVLYAVIVVAAGDFHADFTDTLLWAQASLDSGKLFSPEFYYATAMPFGGQWLMLPFLPLFGAGMATQTIGMVLFALLLALAVAVLGRQALGYSPLWAGVLTAAALLGVSGSLKMRELYWGHIIYYSLGSLFLAVGLTLAVKALAAAEESASSRRTILSMAGVCLWTFLCSLNGMQSLLAFAVPLLAALVLERYLDTSRPLGDMRDPHWRTTGMIAAASLAGMLAGTLLTMHIPTSYANYYSSLSGPDNWMENLLKLPRDWLTLLGYAPKKDTRLMSAEGVINLLRFPGAVAFTLAPAILLALLGRIRDRGVRLLTLAHAMMTAVIVFAYIFGQISNVNWRLSPLVFTAALTTAALARLLWQDAKLRRFALLVLLPLALYLLVSVAQIVGTPPDYRQQNLYYRIAGYLEDQGLDRGYATFWNASSVSVQSDGEVRAAPILIDGGNLRPYRYQSSLEWYKNQASRDTWFLLLSDAEYRALTAQAADLLKKATRTLTAPDSYRVLVFSENFINPDG